MITYLIIMLMNIEIKLEIVTEQFWDTGTLPIIYEGQSKIPVQFLF